MTQCIMHQPADAGVTFVTVHSVSTPVDHHSHRLPIASRNMKTCPSRQSPVRHLRYPRHGSTIWRFRATRFFRLFVGAILLSKKPDHISTGSPPQLLDSSQNNTTGYPHVSLGLSVIHF